jgi:hypothetical protein
MSWLPDDFVHPVRVPVPGIGIHLRPIREADTAIDYPAVTIRPPGPARSSQSGMQLQLVQRLRAGDPGPHPPYTFFSLGGPPFPGSGVSGLCRW